VIFVTCAKAFRNKTVEWLSDCVFSREEKHSLGRAIKEYDPLPFVDGNDSVHCGADYSRQLLLAAAQSLLCVLGLGDVSEGDDSHWLTVWFVDKGPAITEYTVPVLVDTGASEVRSC